jgi:hypothetical protein
MPERIRVGMIGCGLIAHMELLEAIARAHAERTPAQPFERGVAALGAMEPSESYKGG